MRPCRPSLFVVGQEAAVGHGHSAAEKVGRLVLVQLEEPVPHIPKHVVELDWDLERQLTSLLFEKLTTFAGGRSNEVCPIDQELGPDTSQPLRPQAVCSEPEANDVVVAPLLVLIGLLV